MSDEGSVRPVWQHLAERAAALGQPAPKLEATGDPDLRIVAKGRTVRPVSGENGQYVFFLPNGATEVRLISRAGSPTDVRPWLDRMTAAPLACVWKGSCCGARMNCGRFRLTIRGFCRDGGR